MGDGESSDRTPVTDPGPENDDPPFDRPPPPDVSGGDGPRRGRGRRVPAEVGQGSESERQRTRGGVFRRTGPLGWERSEGDGEDECYVESRMPP